jgi:hypothetical protein
MHNLIKQIIKESIREYLNENEEISIRFGRSMKKDGYTVQNVIVTYNNKYITGQTPKTNLGDKDLGNYGEGDTGGHLYLILPDNENVAYVGSVSIPIEHRGKGIGKKIYQSIADKINKPIRSSSEFRFPDGTNAQQKPDGKNFWKNRDSFQPNT